MTGGGLRAGVVDVGEGDAAGEGGGAEEEGHGVDHEREGDPLDGEDESDPFLEGGVVPYIEERLVEGEEGVFHVID